MAFGAEFSIFAHQCLLPLSAYCTRQPQSGNLNGGSDLADGFRCAENVFGKAFQLGQELGWYQDLDSFRCLDLIDLIVELDDRLERYRIHGSSMVCKPCSMSLGLVILRRSTI